MLLEFFGGLLTDSLALLSDSGHMLSDAAALAMSLVAARFSAKPASPNKTYGYYRFEILAALMNGATLFVVSGFIIWEAYGRFFAPPVVASSSMIIIAVIGLLANMSSAWVLMRQENVKENINVRSAYLHVIGDAIGSVGAIIAGVLMYFFSWYVADPIISVLVAVLILKSAWRVMSTAVHILMEGTPVTINTIDVKNTLMKIDGVLGIHDLHIWTLTSGIDSLSCHIVMDEKSNSQYILEQALSGIEQHFKIQHTTIQIETKNLQHSELYKLN
jgi:cobalt-zinc-cadmium efflux system protein